MAPAEPHVRAGARGAAPWHPAVVELWHNPRCSKSRAAKQLLDERGAVYVERRYLERLRQRVSRERLGNVELVLGEPHDPRLPPRSVDLALLVHMYHEIAQPFGLLANLVPAMKPGGRVAILDVDGPIQAHGTPRALLSCELAAVGYEQIGFSKLTGDVGYLAIFKPPTEAQRVPPQAIKPCRVQR